MGEQPERLRITTIDALCASLVRQMPYLSRFGGMPRIADKPFLHYEEAAHRTVAAVEAFPPVAQALACLDNDAAQLRRLLVGMLAFREQWWPHVHGLRAGDAGDREQLGEVLTANLNRLVARDLSVVASAFTAPQSAELMAAARFVAATQAEYQALADWHVALTGALDDLPRWQALAGLLLTKEGTPRKTFNARIGLPAGDPDAKAHAAMLKAVTETLEAQPACIDALRSVAGCPLPRYAAGDLAAIETFAEVLVLAVAQLWTVFQEAGETDFSAIAERALEALGNEEAPTDLALRLDYGIRHLLVDEFQDTNPQQINLLEKLTAGWQPDDGRTLFVVGDPMQSIYRFRKADVGLFLRAWQRGIGNIALEPLTLYRNNRSVPAIVDWVNASFPGIFPSQPDAERGRVSYAPSIATRDDRPGGGVFVHPVLVPKDVVAGDALGDEQEAAAMLQIITETWHAQPQASIAVLVRARDHLRPLIDALRRDAPSLRYEAVEIESLGARQPIQDLLSLTHALCHRADRVHWLAILRAPWCGLTLADLHALFGKVGGGETASETVWSLMHDPQRVTKLSADGRQRLAHAVAALAPVIEAPGRLPLRRQVETAWRRLGGPGCLGSATDQADVAAYFRLLDDLEASGRFERDRLDAEVQSLFAAPSSDPQAAQLKFMTVHKSKGLEFDTVILPGLHRQSGRNERRLLTWDSTQDEQGRPYLVVAPIRTIDSEADEFAEAEEREEDSIRRYIATLEAERADQETRRLLYVAATRAVRCLHLLAVARPKREAKTGLYKIEPPRKQVGKPFNILWPVLAETFEAATTRLEVPATEAVEPSIRFADFVPQLQRLPLASLAMPAHGGTDEEVPLAEAPLYLAASTLAPDVGTLVHRYLELIAVEGLERWPPTRVQQCLPTCEKWLRQQGHDAAASQQGAARVVRALSQALASEKGRWMLQTRADAACELRLTQLDNEAGGLHNHIIDRTFIEDGVRWIIDYKTSVHEGGDVAAFIAAKRAEYAPQLARYAALFPGEIVRQALYFVDLDHFETLT